MLRLPSPSVHAFSLLGAVGVVLDTWGIQLKADELACIYSELSRIL